MKISPIIQAEDLLKELSKKEMLILDVRAGKNALQQYQEQHLNGAIWVDLNSHLAEIPDNASEGGRHPLPDIKHWSKTLAELGISPEKHIVIYDDQNGANAAARCWWMLRSVGHENVQVLNGGIQAAKKAGLPLSDNLVIPEPTGDYPVDAWRLPLADIQMVEDASTNGSLTIVDVRDAGRNRGEYEPIDLIAGHIPGAINIPFIENLDSNGLFLPAEKLKEKYLDILGEVKCENTIFHCGSGVTACHSLLALDYAGLNIPMLYVGSWSEWSRNDKKMITQ